MFTIPFFLHNIPGVAPGAIGDPHVLISSSRQPVNVSLSIPGVEFEIKKTITSENPFCEIDLSLSNTGGYDIRMFPSVGKQNKTIIVRSSDAVNVHAISNDYRGGDGFVVIPTNQLGKRHYLASYQPTEGTAFVCILRCTPERQQT